MFLFVDRILELEPGRRAVGLSHMSACRAFLSRGDPSSPDSNVVSVPPCILGEAAGQLAAWTVMAANDFTRRPVGALIERVDILGQVHGGDPVLLDIRVEEVDDKSLIYHGVARVLGADVVRFENAFSPLLPVEDFDDPSDLGRHFHDIHQPGEASDLSLVASLDPAKVPTSSPLAAYDDARPIDYGCSLILDHDPGREIVAEKRFDGTEPFFADHFPRKPVVPLTVLMECLLRMARQLLDEGSDGHDPMSRITVRNAKINRFIHPNDSIRTTVRMLERGDEGARFRLRCDRDGRRVCQARVEFSTPSR